MKGLRQMIIKSDTLIYILFQDEIDQRVVASGCHGPQRGAGP